MDAAKCDLIASAIRPQLGEASEILRPPSIHRQSVGSFLHVLKSLTRFNSHLKSSQGCAEVGVLALAILRKDTPLSRHSTRSNHISPQCHKDLVFVYDIVIFMGQRSYGRADIAVGILGCLWVVQAISIMENITGRTLFGRGVNLPII